jgi:hypothetical protein
MPDAEPFAAAFTRGPDETDRQFRDRLVAAIARLGEQLAPGTGKQAIIPEDDGFTTFESDETS